MQKNIRRIAGVLFFWLTAFAVFGVVNDIVRFKVSHSTDMIHSFYDIEENTLDVLCIGSSHAYHSVQPNQLWGEYGIPSYVMGSPGQAVACSYHLLREAFKYQKPKIVLLETYCFPRQYKFKNESYLRQAIDGIRFGKVKIEAVNDLLPEYSWKDRMPYYIPFLLYHNRWDDLQSYDFVQSSWLKGGYLYFKQVPQTEPDFPEEPLKIPKMNKEYLKKMNKLCKENGSQLVFFAAPFADIDTAEEALRVNLSVEKYAAKKNIPFLFYQKTNDIGIDYETDFYDNQHLNTKGTEKLTSKLGEWLIQNYELTDHRGEEIYESWDEDYIHYKTRCEELTS